MKPDDVIEVDGTKPSEGGEIVVEHQQAMTPGAVITPTTLQGSPNTLKPFSDKLVQHVEAINNKEDLTPDNTVIQPIDNNVALAGSATPSIDTVVPIAAATGPVQELATQTSPLVAESPPIVDNPPLAPNAEPVVNPNIESTPAPIINSPSEPLNPALSSIATNITEPMSTNVASPAQPTFMSGDIPPMPPQPAPSPAGRFKRKKLLLFGFPMVLIIGVATYVFAFYIPNTPENVWKTGLDRTGKQTEAIIKTLQDKESLTAFEKTQLDIDGTITNKDGESFVLNLDSFYDDTKSSSELEFKTNTQDLKAAVSLMLKTDLPEQALIPNVYFNISGLKSIGADAYLGEIMAYDGKWIAIEQDYIKQFEESFKSQISENLDVTKVGYDGYFSIVSDINSVSQEYIFTSDATKAVIQPKEFIATEQSEGITANHYKAEINKENLKSYCIALSDKVLNNQAYKDITGYSDEELTNYKNESKESCQKSVDELDADTTFDIWFDKKYKLFHKVRVYDNSEQKAQEEYQAELEARYDECLTENNGNDEYCLFYKDSQADQEQELIESYTDFGQIYKGGDSLEFFVQSTEKRGDKTNTARLTLGVNSKTLAFGGAFNYDSEDIKADIKIATQPYDGDIDTAKPEGAVPIEELMTKIFGTPNPYTQVQSRAKDTERMSDISSLHTAMEAYFVQYAYYPSFDQINSQDFRKEFTRGVPDEAFTDPNGTGSNMAASVQANSYSYIVRAGCNNALIPCDAYELVAVLEDGTLYKKQNLN